MALIVIAFLIGMVAGLILGYALAKPHNTYHHTH